MTIIEALLAGAIVGWICAEASERFLVWVDNRTPIADDPIDEYRTHADDVYDQEAEPDLAVAALRAELDAWGRA